MWIVKGIDGDTLKEKIIKKGFEHQYEAEDFIDENYKDIEGVWVEEAGEIVHYDISKYLNQWAWIYSDKMKSLMPYGILVSSKGQFAMIKTKEDSLEEDFSEIRTIKIKEMLEEKKLVFKIQGMFIDIKSCF